MKTVRIYGTARNVRDAPAEVPAGTEVWLSNSPTTVKVRCPRSITQWTRWFNLHSRKHMEGVYPAGFHYYKTQAAGRPIYLLKAQPDVPTSQAFPRERIQAAFATAKGPNRYFTCSVCWLIAFAILEGFERIELWGFELRDTKPGQAHAFERPCFAYWIQMARSRGVDVWYPEAITKLYEAGKMVPGDPDLYTGKLYGYSTKPEPDWDEATESWLPDPHL
jgi:hypothetical protein